MPLIVRRDGSGRPRTPVVMPIYQHGGRSARYGGLGSGDNDRGMNDKSDPGGPAVVRSGPAERAYLLGRAEDHRRLAETASAETRMVHVRLHQLYEERAARIEMVLTD